MELLYIGKTSFVKKEGKTYSLPAYGDAFWQKYLEVFDEIYVLGEEVQGYLNNGTFSEISDKRVKVDILPPNTNPKEFINDFSVKNKLKEYIYNAQAILIKPTSRKGIMAIKIAQKLNKPYMIDITGDLNLTLKNSTNVLKRLYRFYIHKKITKAIKNCKFGLYVTEQYLQEVYRISGKQCGCTDTVILDPNEEVLQNRLKKIETMSEQDEISIGMVASYHDNRKGLDTALEALALTGNKKNKLHVLGLGTQEDRDKWLNYAEKYNVREQLIFDASLSGIENVLKWNDNMDIIILPSRSEGLPRCIVESLSRACPCVISNVCGMPELVEKKWLHNPDDSKKLALLLNNMLSDKELMKNTAKINFEKSKEFKFDVLKKKRNAFLSEFKEYCEDYNKES